MPSDANCSRTWPTARVSSRVETGARFVEKQHRRRGGQGARHLDEPGEPCRQRVAGLVGDLQDPDPSQLVFRFLGRGPPARELVLLHLGSHLDVVAGGERAEQLETLERPPQAEAGARMGPEAGDVLLAQQHLAVGRALESGDHVEQRRLPGAVRPDQPMDLPGRDLERDAIEGLQPSEPHRDVADREHGALRLSQRSPPPAGTARPGHLKGVGPPPRVPIVRRTGAPLATRRAVCRAGRGRRDCGPPR